MLTLTAEDSPVTIHRGIHTFLDERNKAKAAERRGVGNRWEEKEERREQKRGDKKDLQEERIKKGK
jgi:hypothetical protein